MARPLRSDVEDGWYHVMNRGIERRAIFTDDEDRLRFGDLLAQFEERFGVEVHGYCLMENHYHLILRTPLANLSQCMKWFGYVREQMGEPHRET